MEKVLNFLNKNGVLIIIFLSLVIFINQCSIKNAQKKIVKSQKEMVIETKKSDSLLNSKFDAVTYKLDSTLISNGAVINANKQTSDAINNKKQNIIIKMDK
jgi:predicted Holliday junction resolvase-like endonuclease